MRSRGLLLPEQELAFLLQAPLDSAGDKTEQAGQINPHLDRLVQNMESARDGLSHDLGRELQPVAAPLPADLTSGAFAELLGEAAETLLDAVSRFGAAKLVGNDDDKRFGHSEQAFLRHLTDRGRVGSRRSRLPLAVEGPQVQA